jgi:AcrR family transcriptional regulator
MTRPENPELIAAIRKAVLKLTTRKDPVAVTMREIAAECGVTPTTIYYYFENKGRLFEAVKLDIIDDLDRILTAAYNRDDPVKKQLADLMRAFIGWYLENPTMADLVFDKVAPATDLTGELLARYFKANRHAYEIISRGKQTGEFIAEQADVDANLGLAFMYGVARLFINKRVAPRFWKDITPLTNRSIDLFLSGLKA